MCVILCVDQFLKRDIVRERRLRAIELSDPREIGLRGGRWRVSGHAKLTGSVTAKPAGLTDKHLPKKVLVDLSGAFNDFHDLGITVIARNRG